LIKFVLQIIMPVLVLVSFTQIEEYFNFIVCYHGLFYANRRFFGENYSRAVIIRLFALVVRKQPGCSELPLPQGEGWGEGT